jgi:hypothetical protein
MQRSSREHALLRAGITDPGYNEIVNSEASSGSMHRKIRLA